MAPFHKRPLDSILYHQFLKGEYTPSTDSLVSTASRLPEDMPAPREDASTYHWDLKSTNKSLMPAFEYISQKLSEEGLSIHLIVSGHEPFIIPVWPLPRKSQMEMARIIRKACKKFHIKSNWMTALAALDKKGLHQLCESNKSDSYIVRRSLVQHEVIFTQEGLTLLCIDHVYTFKQLLCTLTKPNWVSHGARSACLASSVDLLHRIHTIYTGKPASKAYIARVYPELPFQEDCFDEVLAIYNHNYCTATIHDVAFEPDFSSILAEDPSEFTYGLSASPELPEGHLATGCHDPSAPLDKSRSGIGELVNPLAEVDLSTVRSWESASQSAHDSEVANEERQKSVEVSYPVVKRPASSEQLDPTGGQQVASNGDAGASNHRRGNVPEPIAVGRPLHTPSPPRVTQIPNFPSPPPKRSLPPPPPLPLRAGSPKQTTSSLCPGTVSSNTLNSSIDEFDVHPAFRSRISIDEEADYTEQGLTRGQADLSERSYEKLSLHDLEEDSAEEFEEEDEEADINYEEEEDDEEMQETPLAGDTIQIQPLLNLSLLNGGYSQHQPQQLYQQFFSRPSMDNPSTSSSIPTNITLTGSPTAINSNRNMETWANDDVLESPRAYIESWSSGVVQDCSPQLVMPLASPTANSPLRCF